MSRIWVGIGLVLVLVLQAGCRRAKEEQPAQSTSGEKPQSGISRWMGRDVGPQYAWDGQWSSFNIDSGSEVLLNKTLDVLKAMKFSINEEESRRTIGNPVIEASKTDKTRVSIRINNKTPSSSEIKIRVGTVGDRTGSERILDEIQKLLHPAPRKK